MNRFDPSNQPPRKPDSIRSEINETRQRMDHTIDALSERLRGRHLIDEILGLFRQGNGNGKPLKDKLTATSGAAVHAVVDAVKAHPLPLLVIGAGIAWMFYEKHERENPKIADFDDAGREPDDLAYPSTRAAWSGIEHPEAESAMPFSSEDTAGEPGSGVTESLRNKAGEIKERMQEKSSEMKQRAREGMEHMKARASETGAHIRERASEITHRTKEKFSQATEQHPFETGAAFLALGLIAGLLTPTPEKMREAVRPTAQRVRERVQQTGRDLVERGKQVAHAATEAARSEARSQGLTAAALKERAREAASSATVPGSGPNNVGPIGSPSGPGMNPASSSPGTGTVPDFPPSPGAPQSPPQPLA